MGLAQGQGAGEGSNGDGTGEGGGRKDVGGLQPGAGVIVGSVVCHILSP